MLVLLDGLPFDSWYKQSVNKFIEEQAENEKRQHGAEVSRHFLAQMTGQKMEVANGGANSG